MAFDWGNSFKGGIQGGLAGSPFGPWGAGVGSVLGGITGLFGGNNDEEEETNKILNQIPGELRKYLEPYIKAGQGALGNLNDVSGEYQKLYQDPNSIISRIGAGYKQSPGYQWRLNQGENAITNAAARGGMAGTAQHQQEAGQLAEDLANQDFNDYMKNALGLFGTGLTGRTGIEQGIFNTGATSAGDLATSLANVLKAKAGLNYQRGSQQNALNSDFLSSILGNAGNIKGLFG